MKLGVGFKSSIGFKEISLGIKKLLNPGEWISDGIVSWSGLSSVVVGSYIEVGYTYPYSSPSQVDLFATPTTINCIGYTKLTIEMLDTYASGGTSMYLSLYNSDGSNGIFSSAIAVNGFGAPTTVTFDLTGRTSIKIGVNIGSKNNLRSWATIKSVTLS